MRSWILSSLVTATLLTSACSSGPKYRVDDAVLADLAVTEKQGMLNAAAEVNQAKEELNKAHADLATVERDVAVVDSEYGQSKLEVTKAKADVELAETSKDLSRVTAAKSKLSQTQIAKESADAKLDWYKQKRSYAKALVEVAETHGAAAAARYEQEKARLVEAKGRKPDANFNIAHFDQQAAESKLKWDKAIADANKERDETTKLEGKFNALQGKLQNNGAIQATTNMPTVAPTFVPSNTPVAPINQTVAPTQIPLPTQPTTTAPATVPPAQPVPIPVT